jgi:hypothetical protein
MTTKEEWTEIYYTNNSFWIRIKKWRHKNQTVMAKSVITKSNQQLIICAKSKRGSRHCEYKSIWSLRMTHTGTCRGNEDGLYKMSHDGKQRLTDVQGTSFKPNKNSNLFAPVGRGTILWRYRYLNYTASNGRMKCKGAGRKRSWPKPVR